MSSSPDGTGASSKFGRSRRWLRGDVRPYAFGAAVVVVAMGGIGFLPLFGGPGYEHSLATGLVAPSAAAIATALDASGSRDESRTPLQSVGRGVLAGIVYAGLSLLTALFHAARVGICELWGALLYFALNAGLGAIVGGVWGAFVGELVSALVRRGHVTRRRRRKVLSVLLSLGGRSPASS
ncbi:hypothetical protein AKJ09_09801 [Labilithrix luteola]|uniref:Uncharacterized protein n=1 Tax=Labilithrix luteola TaxID=1391654 RepID=A0A0K1QBM9_9BACT|nr:hypothetical protein [Labilithrix luteola]AKV03138.1 hypothetical protein AKJ09_09801 [Labilithrix luteola]